MKKNKTIVNFILDKSGSMGVIQDATISGVNEYIETLCNDKKSDYSFSLTLFDTEVTTPIKAESIKTVKKLDRTTYTPDGMTALYDAVCRTIKETKVKKNEKVITVIMTDGDENSSREYKDTDMKALIQEREKEGNWTFVYLGANQDSYAKAQKFGIHASNASNYNATNVGMNAVMRTVANNTAYYTASGSASTADFFSKEDQDTLENTK